MGDYKIGAFLSGLLGLCIFSFSLRNSQGGRWKTGLALRVQSHLIHYRDVERNRIVSFVLLKANNVFEKQTISFIISL